MKMFHFDIKGFGTCFSVMSSDKETAASSVICHFLPRTRDKESGTFLLLSGLPRDIHKS